MAPHFFGDLCPPNGHHAPIKSAKFWGDLAPFFRGCERLQSNTAIPINRQHMDFGV